jgi:hypothetical protein
MADTLEERMTQTFIVLLVAVLLLGVCACQRKNGFSVSVGPLEDAPERKDVDGIPFYKKIPVFVQTSIYLDPYYEVSLFVSQGEPGKEAAISSIPSAIMLIAESDLPKFSNFVNQARKLTSVGAILNKFKSILPEKDHYQIRGPNSFKDIPKEDGPAKESLKLPKLYSNNIETRIVVDWKNLYYLNYKTPVVGSSSLAAELNADGTLAKAAGEIEDKTLETIVGAVAAFLPIKEFFTDRWIPATKITKGGLQAGEGIIAISLGIEKKICKYTLTETKRTLSGDNQEILLDSKSAGKTLEILDADSTKNDDKKEAAKNALEFSGHVKLPAEEKRGDK